jgi:lipopolysaccharide transport system permease protein
MEYEIKPVGRFRLNLAEIWSFRELLYFFTWRDVKIKYKQTALGATWALLQPLLMMLVFTLFFSQTLGLETGSLPYPLFVFSGVMLWNVFSSGVNNAGNSMVSNANIIKKIYFPRLLIPMSSILSSLIDFVVTVLLLFLLLIWYGMADRILPLLWAIPLALMISLLATFGLGCLLSALTVKYRDFRYIVPFMLQLLLFLTPVIYPLHLIKQEWIVRLLQLNPMAVSIDLVRTVLDHGTPDPVLLTSGAGVSVAMFLIGISYFRKTENYFADLA